MGVYGFLSSLPAVVGVAGFFAYLWAGQSRIGGELFKQIVAKLRAAPNLDVAQYATLTPAKIGKLVQSDSKVRDVVNEQDQKLLRLLIIFQHVLTVIVLFVCAGLIGLSVWLVMRPAPLAVVVKAPSAVLSDSRGLLVDLDPITVEWASTGKDEPVSVFLENVDDNRRTEKKTVSSDVRSVSFQAADLASVATLRGYHKINRIRSVVEWSANRSVSETKELIVGIEVQLLLFERLIAPKGKPRTIHTLLATIDDSTDGFPQNYCFNTDFVGWTKSSALVIPLRSCNNGEVQIPGLSGVDWSRHVGLVYNGPDDPRIVRTKISGVPNSSPTGH